MDRFNLSVKEAKLLKKELEELFTVDKVYFRYTTKTKKIYIDKKYYGYVDCEKDTIDICDYWQYRIGCNRLKEILKKYNVYFEWMDSYKIGIYDIKKN